MTGKRIGYVRVSTCDQNPDRQLENILLDKKFIEYASARSTDRTQLNAMIDYVREDDLVIVHSMDRLARNLNDLKKILDSLIAKKVKVQFMKENLIFSSETSPFSMLIVHLMGAFAEFEYAFIKERQLEGIAIAKKKGKFKGGVKKLNHERLHALKKEILTTRKTKTQIAKEFGISRFSLYKYMSHMGLHELKKEDQSSVLENSLTG